MPFPSCYSLIARAICLMPARLLFVLDAISLQINPFFATMVSVACGTLNNLLTSDSRQRGVLGGFSAYGSLIPVLMIGLVVPKILSVMNESQAAYTTATLVFAVMAVLACVIGVLCTRETVTENSKDQLKENQTVKESIKALIKNKYFIYLAIFMVGKTIGSVAVIPFTVALILMTGEICGYISSQVDVAVIQPDSAILMIRLLASVYPAVLYLLAAFCFSKIDLEKNGIAEIQKELREKGLR